MIVKKRGHVYHLDHRGGDNTTEVRFVNEEPGHQEEGVTTQEVMRMLIDRTHYCHNCLPHRVNEQIIWHMRQIIALHEARAIEQKAWKGEIKPEFIPLGPDGHFKLGLDVPNIDKAGSSLEEYTLKNVPPLGKQVCNHRSGE